MLSKLVGYRSLDFISDSNDHIQGTQLFIAYADPTSDVVGSLVDKVFVKKQISLPAIKPDDILDISYNNKGKVEKVIVTNPPKA